LAAPSNAAIIPRAALANPHIPAYINNSLVWGVPPAEASAAAAAPEAEAANAPGLPAGFTCQSVGQDGQGQNCG